MTNRGFTIREVGIGDGIQFTSLPENYYRETKKKLVDISKPWYLDFNPYVERNIPVEKQYIKELWNYPKQYEWPHVRDSVYLSNAEIHSSVFGVKNPKLIRPRLYRYENFPFQERELILFHPTGRSHGQLPDHVIEHVLEKYGPTSCLAQIGHESDPTFGIPKIETKTLWKLAEVISQAKMLICVDSGPSWIAACYPDIRIKKVRIKFQEGHGGPEDWAPLNVNNPHSFWDDRAFEIFNVFEDDLGFTQSYRRI